ncbi:hypothetical protein P7E02_11545 [Enterococcus hulanensis]|uniref:hypothetical protein n=1 Tax=Enterococcus hulanensis TaxID=2559929 RepID=UPI0028924BDE|nr:hypothetical protein [Enterococcus hulanensis]MDT2660506.1 hypothetical protein [Enterococcus hulanensis]
MITLLDTLSKHEEIILIVFFLIGVDITITTVKSIIDRQYTNKGFVSIIWKNLSNCIAILLCSVFETVLIVNEIDFEIELTQGVCCLIILIICKSTITTLGDSELTVILRGIIDNILSTLKIRMSTNNKK